MAVFQNLGLPMVVMDSYFESAQNDFVLINNIQGAYLATDYLIRKRKQQPGYLRSAYPIGNFEERADGFFKAIRKNGMSTGNSVVHRLSPSYNGAYADMAEIINSGDRLAPCYFADNDLIAVGAMRALQDAGYKIPKDIAIIGFDDIPLCSQIEPQLTTVNVPMQYFGQLAIERLLLKLKNPTLPHTKSEVLTKLVLRKSV